MKIQKIYQPYFNAVKKIISGKPVTNLESIRTRCNEKSFAKTGKRKKYGNYPGAMFVCFVSDAENKILMGEKPESIYNFSNKSSPEEFRKKCRRFLDILLTDYP